MRLKRPPQPLVFQFSQAGALCSAAGALYQAFPQQEGALCLYGGAYYLRVEGSLGQRNSLRRLLEPYGRCLGACPVLYAYWEEHGRSLSADPVRELGQALGKG